MSLLMVFFLHWLTIYVRQAASICISSMLNHNIDLGLVK